MNPCVTLSNGPKTEIGILVCNSQNKTIEKLGTATGTILTDNTRVRMTEWRFKNLGDITGWHRHEHDHVGVPFSMGSWKSIWAAANGQPQI